MNFTYLKRINKYIYFIFTSNLPPILLIRIYNIQLLTLINTRWPRAVARYN